MSMLDNFKNISADYIPDNRNQTVSEEEFDEIIVGGTCTHIFTLPVVLSEYASDVTILYKQGLETVLQKSLSDCSSVETETTTTLTLKLSSDDTEVFDSSYLNTFVQLKLTLKNDDIQYTDPNKLIVRKPIEDISASN